METFEGSKKHRGYFFTFNNFTPEEEGTLKSDSFEYLIYQVEKGSEGTEHLQAFIYYKNPRVWPKRKYPRAHIEPAKSFEASIKYCSKEKTRVRGPYEFGTKPEQGRRTDLEEIAELIKNGASISDVADFFPAQYIRYHKGLKELKQIYRKNRETEPVNTWLWGLSGVGKTSYVFNKHGRDNVYVKDGTQWWDGYDSQEVIIIDDFDGKWPFRDLLRLLDRYPYQGQVKGGYVKINSALIYITCEFPPEEVFKAPTDFETGKKDDNHLNQILRRLHSVFEVKRKDNEKIRLPKREVLEL